MIMFVLYIVAFHASDGEVNRRSFALLSLSKYHLADRVREQNYPFSSLQPLEAPFR